MEKRSKIHGWNSLNLHQGNLILEKICPGTPFPCVSEALNAFFGVKISKYLNKQLQTEKKNEANTLKNLTVAPPRAQTQLLVCLSRQTCPGNRFIDIYDTITLGDIYLVNRLLNQELWT